MTSKGKGERRWKNPEARWLVWEKRNQSAGGHDRFHLNSGANFTPDAKEEYCFEVVPASELNSLREAVAGEVERLRKEAGEQERSKFQTDWAEAEAAEEIADRLDNLLSTQQEVNPASQQGRG